MAKDTNSRVELEIRNGSSMQYGAPREISITVRDRASGQTIVVVPLTADQLLASLAGTYHGNLEAWVVPPDLRARIGLKSVHAEVRIPRNLSEKFDRSTGDNWGDWDALPEDVATWILDTMQPDGWTEWRISRHNYGLALHLTKYVDPSEVAPAGWEKV